MSGARWSVFGGRSSAVGLRWPVLGAWLIACGLAGGARAQDLEVGGYFEHQLFPQRVHGRTVLLDYNKLRLDFGADGGERLRFDGDYLVQLYHGATRFSAFDYIPERVVAAYARRQGVPVEVLAPQFTFSYDDEHVLDNAHVTYYADAFNVRAGKQQLPWGSGYAWNPTDVFHAKNLLDPTYEKRGVNALRLQIPFGAMGGVTGVLGVEEDLEWSTKAVRVTQHVGGFDLAVVLAEEHESRIDFDVFEETLRRRRLLGGDLSGELGGLGIWLEGGYYALRAERDFAAVVAGLDYTFENGLHVMVEYYHHGAGASGRVDYTFNDWMRLISTQGENLGRDYLFAGHTFSLTDLLTWSTFALASGTDGSAVVYPYVVYSLGDNSELTLIGYASFGSADAELGAFGAGLIARLRVYF